MNFRTRSIFICFLFIIAGILLGTELPFFAEYAIGAVILGALIFALGRGKHAILAIAVICLGLSFLNAVRFNPNHAESFPACTITGKVQSVQGEDEATLILTDARIFDNEKSKENQKVLVVFDKPVSVKEGNIVTITAEAFPYRALEKNPGENKFSLAAENVSYVAYASEAVINDASTDINYYFASLRREIKHKIYSQMPETDTAAIAYAMVSGEKRYISSGVKSQFALSGVSHILAVSGLHTQIFLSVFAFAISKIKGKRWIKLLLTGALMAFCCFLTGFTASVIRAAIMAFVLAFTKAIGRRNDSINSLSLVGTLVLLVNPNRLFDISFQMSYSACFGIVALMPKRIKYASKIKNYLRDALFITVFPTIATLPLGLYYFGTASTVTVLANMLLVPVFSLALGIMIAILSASFLMPFILPTLKIPYYMLYFGKELTEYFARAPVITVYALSGGFVLIALGAVVLFSKVTVLRKRAKQILAVILVLCLLIYSGISYQKDKNQLEINVIALENSVDCVFIRQNRSYFIGVATNVQDVVTQAEYINNCVGKVDGLIILSQEQAEYLSLLMSMNVEIDKIYLPRGEEITDFNGLPEQIVSPENIDSEFNVQNGKNTIPLQDGQIIISQYGALIEYKDKTVLLTEFDTDRRADVAITQNPNVYAETVISCNKNHKNNEKVYFTSVSGRVKIKINDKISVETFR
ncbi:MAG: ComEC/Rec2 family competence protein [Clostridia bacterium]|nr:ComEC/Rec2 family competence protein [Clostridia bacterium]